NSTATGYRGRVHFTSSDAAAVLPGDYTFTAADAGVHSFTATLKTPGSRTLTVKDTANASITGSAPILVHALHFDVAAPATVTRGRSFSFTVTAKDDAGVTVTGYTGSVHFTSSDPAASLPPDAAF